MMLLLLPVFIINGLGWGMTGLEDKHAPEVLSPHQRMVSSHPSYSARLLMNKFFYPRKPSPLQAFCFTNPGPVLISRIVSETSFPPHVPMLSMELRNGMLPATLGCCLAAGALLRSSLTPPQDVAWPREEKESHFIGPWVDTKKREIPPADGMNYLAIMPDEVKLKILSFLKDNPSLCALRTTDSQWLNLIEPYRKFYVLQNKIAEEFKKIKAYAHNGSLKILKDFWNLPDEEAARAKLFPFLELLAKRTKHIKVNTNLSLKISLLIEYHSQDPNIRYHNGIGTPLAYALTRSLSGLLEGMIKIKRTCFNRIDPFQKRDPAAAQALEALLSSKLDTVKTLHHHLQQLVKQSLTCRDKFKVKHLTEEFYREYHDSNSTLYQDIVLDDDLHRKVWGRVRVLREEIQRTRKNLHFAIDYNLTSKKGCEELLNEYESELDALIEKARRQSESWAEEAHAQEQNRRNQEKEERLKKEEEHLKEEARVKEEKTRRKKELEESMETMNQILTEYEKNMAQYKQSKGYMKELRTYMEDLRKERGQLKTAKIKLRHRNEEFQRVDAGFVKKKRVQRSNRKKQQNTTGESGNRHEQLLPAPT